MAATKVNVQQPLSVPGLNGHFQSPADSFVQPPLAFFLRRRWLGRRHQSNKLPQSRCTHRRSDHSRRLPIFRSPVWIKLRHLPVELWTTEGLSTVASGIGRPLYPDAITRACTRLDFARVCVMLKVSSKLPKHVVIMMPNELGGESACKVDVEYEWLPPKCTGCSSLGHNTKECPLSKPTKPAISIFVKKSMPITKAAPEWKISEQGQADLVPEVIHPETKTDRVVNARRDLWQGLIELAVTVGNVPWLVGGDFNAVLDMSEVSLFRFDNYLALSPGFLASVQSIWRTCYGTPMYSVTRKLKALKSVFRKQRSSKGDLAMNVKLAAGFLEAGLSQSSKLEQVMLRQRAKLQWLKGGDQCSKEDKAPGPDGFSSGFFKAAWPVVGEEVSKAIIDFFKTGRLLKTIECYLLTLIPKPFSKCICPGRLITDNILLAQELFSGYNQCRLPPRCGLKVDLRKAYDTVEWDFLIATLRMFGFPAVFIRWIEECVTSAHYSVVVNGGVNGFFAGARGLDRETPCLHIILSLLWKSFT
ncbi:hypothetical protein Sango_2931200 [Sesamum angolense]|uniref:Reverse transcriptase domain-containing protein n=1 Tax=Sesamum angolense TaxID=2727404 RepID=A0AAE1T4S9_9LAMI|nr:hypothetical protein Sango_2931200 [Sesamum angolense]